MEVAHSSYLDFTGYRITDDMTVVRPTGSIPPTSAATTAGINVAIILDRVQDPTTLLSQNWGTRSDAGQLDDSGTLWSTYGADQAQYDAVVTELRRTPTASRFSTGPTAADGDYVSSAESRTIWVEIDTAAQFSSLFGTTLYVNDAPATQFMFWNGNLLLPSEWNVQGLWFDTENSPPPSNLAPAASVAPTQGAAEHRATIRRGRRNMSPQDIAASTTSP